MVIKKGKIVKKVAGERIEILHKLAKEEHQTDPKLSKRYLKLAKEISRHYKIKLDKVLKREVCRKCDSLLVPGKTVTIRLVSSKRQVLYKCLNCGAERRISY